MNTTLPTNNTMPAELWDQAKKHFNFTDEKMIYYFGERGEPSDIASGTTRSHGIEDD